MGIRHSNTTTSLLDGKVVGRSGMDKKVTVTVKRGSAERSTISIRIGFSRDESLSRALFGQIEKRL